MQESLLVTWPYLHPPVRTKGNQCETLHFLASVTLVWEPANLILHINVVINWQLSKQSIHWPVLHDRIAGSGVDPNWPIRFKLIRYTYRNTTCLFFKDNAVFLFFFTKEQFLAHFITATLLCRSQEAGLVSGSEEQECSESVSGLLRSLLC